MRYAKLGNSNIDVSVIGLGTWAIGGRWWGGTDEKDSIEAIIASIDAGINFIDTMETFLKMKEKGKIRAIGVSNISIDQIKEYSTSGTIDTDQEKYNILDRDVEAKLLPWCKQNGASMLAYSPMAKGLLTGKISPDRIFSKDDSRFGDERYLFVAHQLNKNHDISNLQSFYFTI